MAVFAASGQARTFDFRANDVGYVPFAMGHTSRTPGTRRCSFWKSSKAIAMLMFR